MKKKFILLLLFNQFLFSQSAKITYDIHVDNTDVISNDKEIQERFINMAQLANKFKVELLISNQKSSFICKDLFSQSDDQFEAKSAKVGFVAANDIFIDKESKKIYYKENDGQITTSELSNNNWMLLDETKIIDNILCHKATLNLNLMGRKGNPIIQTIVAWYAPSIPYSFGPKEFNGLPGLILELKHKRTTYIASKIELFDEDIVINIPKGNTIERKDYINRVKENIGF